MDLEKERHNIEKEMNHLQERRRRVRRAIQQEQLKKLTPQDESTIPTAVCTSNGSRCSREKCQACCRKDQIIHRCLDEIQELRRQLRQAQKMNRAAAIEQVRVSRILEQQESTTTVTPPSDQESPKTGEEPIYQEPPSFYPPTTLYCDNGSVVSEVTLR